MNRADHRRIPVVSFAMAEPFAAALTRDGIDAKTLLADAGLPEDGDYREERFVSAQSWFDFLNLAADAVSDRRFAYNVGTAAAFSNLPNMRILRFERSTLGELLTATVINSSRLTTMASYSLTIDGDTATLQVHRSFTPRRSSGQPDGYFAGFSLRLLRMCLGPEIGEGIVELQVSEPEAVGREARAICKVTRGGRLGAWIRMPAEWMLRETTGLLRQASIGGGRPASEVGEAMRQILAAHLSDPDLDIEKAAHLAGHSVGSLQWSLAKAGTSFSAELNRLRRLRALHLLETTQASISAVAAAVGFQDPTSFSRAFRRWEGVSPREHRASRPSG